MLAEFIVFSRTGLIFWSKGGSVLRGNPIDDFIKNVILESKINSSSYSTDSYTLKWTLANETKPGLVFLCIYSKSLQLSWVSELLDLVKTKFIKQHAKNLNVENCPLTFDFEKILHKAMGFQPAPQAISPVASSRTKVRAKQKRHCSPRPISAVWYKLKTRKKKRLSPTAQLLAVPNTAHHSSVEGKNVLGQAALKRKTKLVAKKTRMAKSP